MATCLSYFGIRTAVRSPTLPPSKCSLAVETQFGGTTVTSSSGPTLLEYAQQWVYRNRWLIAGAGVVASFALPPRYGMLAGVASLSTLLVTEPLQRARCPELFEGMAAEALGVAECTKVGGVAVNNDPETQVVTAATRAWVRKVKLHFGEVKDTPAEQICVKRWLAEKMKEADMRDSDARGLIPVVAFLATVPDVDDVAAQCVRNSAVVRNMRVLGGSGSGK